MVCKTKGGILALIKAYRSYSKLCPCCAFATADHTSGSDVGNDDIRNLLPVVLYTIIKLPFQNISICLKYEKSSKFKGCFSYVEVTKTRNVL